MYFFTSLYNFCYTTTCFWRLVQRHTSWLYHGSETIMRSCDIGYLDVICRLYSDTEGDGFLFLFLNSSHTDEWIVQKSKTSYDMEDLTHSDLVVTRGLAEFMSNSCLTSQLTSYIIPSLVFSHYSCRRKGTKPTQLTFFIFSLLLVISLIAPSPPFTLLFLSPGLFGAYVKCLERAVRLWLKKLHTHTHTHTHTHCFLHPYRTPLCRLVMWPQCIERTLCCDPIQRGPMMSQGNCRHPSLCESEGLHRDAAPPPLSFLLVAVVNGIAWLCSSITVKCKEKGSLVQNFMIHNWLNRGVISWLNREVCSKRSKAFSCPCEIRLGNRLMGPIESWRCKVLRFIQRAKKEPAIRKGRA